MYFSLYSMREISSALGASAGIIGAGATCIMLLQKSRSLDGFSLLFAAEQIKEMAGTMSAVGAASTGRREVNNES